jgi:ornithine cyclodeaminase/alanine dehydrogenase-like protein (mu-crystallin family)
MPSRQHLAVPGGELLYMPAFGPGGVGVKLITICPENPGRRLPLIHGLYMLFAPGELRLEAVFDGPALTAVRTAAVSALATQRLARPDSSRLIVFGAGAQARAHVPTMAAVRPLTEVVIVDRNTERVEALVEVADANNLRARRGTPEDVAGADIICTCTTSRDPVFPGALLPPGAHVNAIGAYRPDHRELEGTLLARSTVVVETREAALPAAGDLVLAIAEGHLRAGDLAGELRDVVRGTVTRRDDDECTIFKSVGLAVEDLVIARAAVVRLREAGRVA